MIVKTDGSCAVCSCTHNPLAGNCIMELLGPGSRVTQQEEEREAAALIC